MSTKLFSFSPGFILLVSILTYPTPPYPTPNGPQTRTAPEPRVQQSTGRNLPDLKFNRSRTVNITIEQRTFAADHCAVVERCVRGSGRRSLLRFDVAVANVGKGDLRLGDPRRNPRVFQFSPCHGHYHFRDLITYEVHNASGKLVFRGSKQAFCLRDNYKYLDTAPESRGYDCDNQGLTAGWEDVYDRSLDCQWIDVTGIRPGRYTLPCKDGDIKIKVKCEGGALCEGHPECDEHHKCKGAPNCKGHPKCEGESCKGHKQCWTVVKHKKDCKVKGKKGPNAKCKCPKYVVAH